jgi:hypothetical protein
VEFGDEGVFLLDYFGDAAVNVGVVHA